MKQRTPKNSGRPPRIPLTLIYVPGLFDRLKWVQFLQRKAVATWRTFGVRPQVFVMGWSLDAAFDDRLGELEKLVDAALARGEKVALVGASAGATAVLALLAKHPEKISAVVTICGKIHRPDNIPEPVLELNSVFDQGLDELPALLEELGEDQLGRTLALHAYRDHIVPPEDAVLNGAHNRQIPALGHVPGIAVALLSFAPLITKFCKAQAAVHTERESGS